MTEPLSASPASIAKKQYVAVTGLLLIGFVIAHLAGNLFIYLGPEAFNGYAAKLAHLRPGLYVVEALLLAIFVSHMYVTALLVLENIKARGTPYKLDRSKGTRSLATVLMPYTGVVVLAFVVFHLWDFTFIDHDGPRSILADGKSYGLYGVVYNSFADPLHSAFYIAAMAAVGLHLCHGVESFMQTFGIAHDNHKGRVVKFSWVFAIAIVVGYSSIPVYVMIKNSLM